MERVSEPCRTVRLAGMAFADHPLHKVSAHDLVPAFTLFPRIPEQRRLEPIPPSDLRSLLSRVPSSSGGDFVDALADALAECASARWHPEARKLRVVTGDSPGYSILNPAPWGANAAVREKDVETVALDLHRKGVEVVTIYHPSPPKAESTTAPESPTCSTSPRPSTVSWPRATATSTSWPPASTARRRLRRCWSPGRRWCGGRSWASSSRHR